MGNAGISQVLFSLLDRITDKYPEFGQTVIQKIFSGVLGSDKVYKKISENFWNKLKKIKSFERILFIADVNIGDSIIVQSGILALREIFKESRIDYICNNKGGEMIKFIPEANNIFNIVNGKTRPNEEDIIKIKDIIDKNDYTMILNMSPFLPKDIFNKNSNVLHIYILFGFYITHLWNKNSERMHIFSATYDFLYDLFKVHSVSEKSVYIDNLVSKLKIYISEKDILDTKEFLNRNGINGKKHILLFNTDATTKFCIIPKDLQIQIIKKTVTSPNIDKLLISFGKDEKEMKEAIEREISDELMQKILYVPFLPIPVYAALLDYCDMFLSGDTGLVHLAEAFRVPLSLKHSMRNSTSVVTLFGATDSRMYGYDFERSDHLNGGQFSVSKVFSGNSLCRNITCTNKSAKTCKNVRCFDGINSDEVSEFINSYFEFLRIPEKILKQKVLA